MFKFLHFQKSDNVDKFWAWFQENSDRLYNLKNGQDHIFKELTKQIRLVNPHLAFAMSPEIKGRREFVISADGIKEAFPFVQQLKDSAPKLKKWEIIGFRPREKNPGKVAMGNFELDVQSIYFQDYPNKDKVGLDLFIKDYNEQDQRFVQASFILLDALLGEFDVATKIGFINFKGYSDDSEVKDLKKLEKLPAVVDNYKPS